MNLILEAASFAAQCHKDQKRKITGEPYINHPLRVASHVSMYTTSPSIIVAALLHDVVEDCGITVEKLEDKYGQFIGHLVDQLTNKYTKIKYPDWNRQKRHEAEHVRLADCRSEARLIKLCDRIDNCRDILSHPEWDFYRKESRHLLTCLRGANEELEKELENLL